jgi:hypothetical protein
MKGRSNPPPWSLGSGHLLVIGAWDLVIAVREL